MATSSSLEPSVPLPLSPDILNDLQESSKDWALTHGLVVMYMSPDQICCPDRITYVPHTLLPSPIPRQLFERMVSLQPHINLLMHRVAEDREFMTSALKSTIKVDDFTAKLFEIYEEMHQAGFTKPVKLTLLRSDYMIDTSGPQQVMKQVEINTMASSFGGLAANLTHLHKYNLGLHSGAQSNFEDNLPKNESLEALAEGMVKAWQLYGRTEAVVCYVVCCPEQNIFDQRLLEFMMKKKVPCIRVIRRGLSEMGKKGHLSEDRRLFVDGLEVAVVYYRVGYVPSHFCCGEKAWDAKLLAEKSLAVTCPSIDWHLAGTKKIQQELSRPGVLEKFLDDPAIIADIRATFAGQYHLELDEEGDAAAIMGIRDPERYVLKPQREGGGNNFFGDELMQTLTELQGKEERAAYILMERIHPQVISNYEVRGNQPVQLKDMVSELGIFGIFVSKSSDVVMNTCAGHLLRTKNVKINEGGLAMGASCMDSPYLV
ncbi:glutathione synthetase-like [Acanthaster planci]|uniref:Glutathione synthetase n=1 Tax=Acanthaster planci TaxID=133434 RepID=A0A8B7XUL6_ACAPL|nr:glutathione synthetase-like [Acanthaster planci]XP_022083932.1 glutathione synthetase-like [Acanthaster planci]XP_022083933.1 glutathione synthetase-like [Acanthaster planci]